MMAFVATFTYLLIPLESDKSVSAYYFSSEILSKPPSFVCLKCPTFRVFYLSSSFEPPKEKNVLATNRSPLL